jgi:hypothetical protein
VELPSGQRVVFREPYPVYTQLGVVGPPADPNNSAPSSDGKSCESSPGRWDFGWEMAHAAVTRGPPISLYTMVLRTGGVHRSRAISCRAAPYLSVTIRITFFASLYRGSVLLERCDASHGAVVESEEELASVLAALEAAATTNEVAAITQPREREREKKIEGGRERERRKREREREREGERERERERERGEKGWEREEKREGEREGREGERGRERVGERTREREREKERDRERQTLHCHCQFTRLVVTRLLGSFLWFPAGALPVPVSDWLFRASIARFLRPKPDLLPSQGGSTTASHQPWFV